MKTILLVKTSAIGDVIQTFPVLEYLRQKYPSARIDWVVEKGSQSLLEAHPDLNHVLTIDTKSWKRNPFSSPSIFSSIKALRSTHYDLIFDLQGNWKSAVVTLLARGEVKVGFDRQGVREKGNLLATNHQIAVPEGLNIRERYLQLVQRYLGVQEGFISSGVILKLTPSEQERKEFILQNPIFSKRPRIMVCFGSRWKNKQLKELTLVTLLEKIVLDYDPSYVFVFGNKEEEEEARRLSSLFPSRSLPLGGMSLPLWQVLMEEMDLCIAVDSAALHLCATTKTPSFSVFGPSNASVYKPLGETHQHIQGPCPYGRSFVSRCPVLRTCPTGACIRDLSPDALFLKCKDLLDCHLGF